MKKHTKVLLFLFFIGLLLFFTACKQTELPNSPSAPGKQGMFAGKAIAATFKTYPDWAAKPNKMFVYPENVEYEDELRVKILDYDFLYRFGYYFNSEDGVWELFELDGGTRVQDWYLDRTARATIEIDRDVFQIGENYIVLYACNKKGEYFECNENKWMLTYFRVESEEDYDFWIIEEDIDDFIFLSSRREKKIMAGEKLKIYIAEYMNDNDKAIVEVSTITTTTAAKRFLRPWNTFIQHYTAYDGSNISYYLIDDEYYILWMSENTAIKIFFENEEFPTDLVDAYLEKWPSTKINLTNFELPEQPGAQAPLGPAPVIPAGCGDGKIRGTERCDPAESRCIVEEFPILEIKNGDDTLVNTVRITVSEIISDLTPALAFINVGGKTELMQENQLIKFDKINAYVHVFSILPDRVKLAFGYSLGNCTQGCRCTYAGIQGDNSVCGDGKIEGIEECEKPGDSCYAKSGLLSTCDDTCKCPEPFIGLTFCGDGIVQRPNSFRIMEMCDPANVRCIVGTKLGLCTANCQCIIGQIPNVCGDYIVNPNIKDDCDPPGSLCIKEGSLGKCIPGCDCEELIPQPKDWNELSILICGTDDPECWNIGGECEKDGRQGICNISCECEIGQEDQDSAVCGDGEIEGAEECEPPFSVVERKTLGYTEICNTDCKIIKINEIGLSDQEKEEYINKLKMCGTIYPECWEIDDNCQKNGEEGFCNVSCECEIGQEDQEPTFCGDGEIEGAEECEPPFSIIEANVTDKSLFCGGDCKIITINQELSQGEKTEFIRKLIYFKTLPFCGDYDLDPIAEECDPPLSDCIFENPLYYTPLLGICQQDCGCRMKDICECFSIQEEWYLPLRAEASQYLLDCETIGCSENVELEEINGKKIITITMTSDVIDFIKYSFANNVPVERCECVKENPQPPNNQVTAKVVIDSPEKTKTSREIIISIIACIFIIGIMVFNVFRK